MVIIISLHVPTKIIEFVREIKARSFQNTYNIFIELKARTTSVAQQNFVKAAILNKIELRTSSIRCDLFISIQCQFFETTNDKI